MKVYELVWTWCEDDSPQLFFGPPHSPELSEDEWGALCIAAVRKAADTVLSQQLPVDRRGWMGLPQFFDAAVKFLNEQGFEAVTTVKATAFGGYIINSTECKEDSVKRWLTPELIKRTVQWNDEVRRELYGNTEPVWMFAVT